MSGIPTTTFDYLNDLKKEVTKQSELLETLKQTQTNLMQLVMKQEQKIESIRLRILRL